MTEPLTKTAPVSVKVERLSKTYRSRSGSVQVLKELTLDVHEGEMLVLLGPSGCGKTTLLRCLVGLEEADSGRITLGDSVVADGDAGTFVAPDKRGVGMVFQNYALWPHMTIARNIEFPLRARGLSSAINEGRVKEVLDIVQCGHLADRYPPQLSGGQQQRIALARALASRPDVMLLDEPLSNLDALLRVDLRAQLHLLHRNLGFTGIYVTHDQVEAMSLGTRVVVMRSGAIEQIGRPKEIYFKPANEYVAGFLGMRNRLPVKLSPDTTPVLRDGVIEMSLPGSAVGKFHLRARPGELLMRLHGTSDGDKAGVGWVGPARVVDVLPCGQLTEFVVEIGGHTLYLEAPGHDLPRKDESIDIGIQMNDALVYDEAGDLHPSSPGAARRLN